MGNAGVGVISMRGAPLALPTFATAQFRSFFGCGRACGALESGAFRTGSIYSDVDSHTNGSSEERHTNALVPAAWVFKRRCSQF